MFPTDSNFKNRIIEAEFGPSKNTKNPMITLSLELDSPDEVEIGGEMYTIGGIKTKFYIVTAVLPPEGAPDDVVAKCAEKTENCKKRAIGLLTSMGMEESSINWDNINVQPLKGKLVYCMMESNPVERRANPTAAEIIAARSRGKEPQGRILKDPIKGHNLVDYWPSTVQIFGLVPGATTTTMAF